MDAKAGDPIPKNPHGTQREVLPACEQADGVHVCLPCRKRLANNLEATQHGSLYPMHSIAWLCAKHGIESAV